VEAAACGLVGVAAAELGSVRAGDPVQQPSGIVDARVGAHQVEHRSGMLDQVAGQAGGTAEGVGANRLGPSITQMGSQV
jgi:hypothetical protein